MICTAGVIESRRKKWEELMADEYARLVPLLNVKEFL